MHLRFGKALLHYEHVKLRKNMVHVKNALMNDVCAEARIVHQSLTDAVVGVDISLDLGKHMVGC